ncbi:JmjC domain-containing protein [Streptomyces chartreusis]|uniref:JmjC domain-containing protein n=1 Tax=Streptomyces chartreusis TaxID=1969 RepID=UPI0036CFB09F
MSTADFLRSKVGKEPHVFSGNPGRFHHLLPWSTVDDILKHHWLEPGRVTLSKDGHDVPIDEYNPQVMTFSGASATAKHRRVEASALYRHLRDGATLQIKVIDELVEPISRLAASLEAALKERVTIDAFISFGTVQGFKTHFDYSEVIALQVFGRKHWAISEPTRRWPRVGDPGSKTAPEPSKFTDLLISDGDVLYLPRGWWHRVQPVNEITVHLGVAVFRRTGIDLMRWLVHRLNEEDICRQDLPRPSDPKDRQLEHLNALQEAMVTRLREDGLLSSFFDAFYAAQPSRQAFDLASAMSCDALPDEDDFAVRWLNPFAVVTESKEGLIVKSGTDCVELPKNYSPLVSHLRSSNKPVTVQSAKSISNLTEESHRSALSALALAGLIEIAHCA